MSLALKALGVSLPKLLFLALASPVCGDSAGWSKDLVNECVYQVCECSAETKCVVMGDKPCSDKLSLCPVLRIRLVLNKELASTTVQHIEFVFSFVLSGDLVCAGGDVRASYPPCEKVNCLAHYLWDRKSFSSSCALNVNPDPDASDHSYFSVDVSGEQTPSELLVSICFEVPSDAFVSKSDPEAIVQDVAIDMTNVSAFGSQRVELYGVDGLHHACHCRRANSPSERYCDMEWEWGEHTGGIVPSEFE